MYPNLYYAVKDLFGIELSFLRFLNSFGFFVAIAFMAAAYVLSNELKRKEGQGLLPVTSRQVLVGAPASWWELISNGFLGFLVGYKFVGLFLSKSPLAENPQAYIFSAEGNWATGILLAAVFGYLKWQEKNKEKLPKPEMRTEKIWPHQQVGDLVILAAIFGFGGAKIFHNLENWNDFVADPIGALLAFSGLTFYGGLICAALAIWYWAKKRGVGIWHLNDAAAPALMLAYAVGRIGCQVSGDGDWGIENVAPNPYSWLPDWAWSYRYPNNVLGEGVAIPGCEGLYCAQLPNPVYPTPLYETVMGLVIFGILMVLRKYITTPGKIFAIYLIFNGVERFLIEKIRVNNKYDFGFIHPTQAELISGGLVLAGIILLWMLKPKPQLNS